jgi:hypothetical protein
VEPRQIPNLLHRRHLGLSWAIEMICGCGCDPHGFGNDPVVSRIDDDVLDSSNGLGEASENDRAILSQSSDPFETSPSICKSLRKMSQPDDEIMKR